MVPQNLLTRATGRLQPQVAAHLTPRTPNFSTPAQANMAWATNWPPTIFMRQCMCGKCHESLSDESPFKSHCPQLPACSLNFSPRRTCKPLSLPVLCWWDLGVLKHGQPLPKIQIQSFFRKSWSFFYHSHRYRRDKIRSLALYIYKPTGSSALCLWLRWVTYNKRISL